MVTCTFIAPHPLLTRICILVLLSSTVYALLRSLSPLAT